MPCKMDRAYNHKEKKGPKMALSEGDKNTCKEIAREIIKEVLIVHITSCPHGKTILASKMLLVGMCIGSGLASGLVGGSVVVALVRFVSGN